MALKAYIEFAEVRAALGVSVSELKDDVLELPLYEGILIKELEDVSPTCLADYTAVNDKDDAAKTTAEKDFQLAFELFSVFAVARGLTSSLPLFSPKSIGDGKASASRFSDSPYKDTIEAIGLSYEEYRKYLISKYAIFNGGSSSDSAPIPMVGIMSPATDPVTGT